MPWMAPQYIVIDSKREENKMPEIRASVTVEVHRKLKEEAARDGKHLKELVSEVLVAHLRNGTGGLKEKSLKKGG